VARPRKPREPLGKSLPELGEANWPLFFISAALSVFVKEGSVGIRVVHSHAFAPDAITARTTFLENLQGAPFGYHLVDLIITELPRDKLLSALAAPFEPGVSVWH